MRNRLLVISGLAAVAVLATACGSSTSGAGAYGTSGSGQPSASSPATASAMAGQGASAKTVMVKTKKTRLGRVLTNARGFTLYWYAEDTAASSKCTGACATTWPPLLGKPQVEMGFKLTSLGTVTRPDGTIQVTYKGHPLYLYVQDTVPGTTTGNGVGGKWHAMLKKATALSGGGSMASPTQSASSGGSGGYKY
jgi:predicted lipoprotein with Yx(FWY)xxD motif